MVDWFVQTLRSYPEIAILLSLAFGYYFGSFNYKGLGLGAVTATLIAAVIIGQLDIPVTGPLKPFFFLMFLFAIGYGVGPQFVRGIASDGLPQAVYAAVVCVFCLFGAYLAAKLAGYDVGSAAGLYAGSQTISASMGLATDAINRLGLSPEETKKLLDAMPVAYAVTYIFGTMGSAIVIALLGPALLGIDLEAACKRYEEKHGGKKQVGGPGTAWHQFELRAFRVRNDGPVVGKTAQEAEALLPEQPGVRPTHPARRPDHGRDRRNGDPGGRRCGHRRPPRRAGEVDRRRSRRGRRPRTAGGADRRRRCLRDQQGGRRQDP